MRKNNIFPDKNFRDNFIVLSILMLVYLFLRINYGDYRLVDSFEYFQTAELLSSLDYFIPTQDIELASLLTKRDLIYPLLILITGKSDLLLILFQTIIGILNLYLILKLFHKLGGKSYKILSLFIILCPSIFIYCHLVMTEVIAMTFILLLAFQFLENLNNKRIWVVQILIILLVLLKPGYYLFVFINLIFFLILSFKNRKIYYTPILPVLIVFLVFIFNNYRTGYFHFSSMQNVNLVNYNIYLFKSKNDGVEKANAYLDSINDLKSSLKTFKAQNEFLTYSSKEFIKENFIGISFHHIVGSIRGMLDPGRFDIMSFVEKHDPQKGLLYNLNKKEWKSKILSLYNDKYLWVYIILIPIFLINVVKYSLIACFLWKKRFFLKHRFIYLILFIIYSIFIIGPVNVSRYMMPIQGLIIAISVLSLEFILTIKIKKHPFKNE